MTPPFNFILKMNLSTVLFLILFGTINCKIINLSCRQIKAFVDGHNSRRLQLARGEIDDQPPASDMTYMVWDEELAAKAEKWASKNVFKHNPDKTVDSDRFTTGENLYKYSTTNLSTKLNPDVALQAWFQEHKDFTYGEMKLSYFNRKVQIGHYTQMAWSNSIYVGCAINHEVDKWNRFLVVCNYGPSGNYIGEKPYESDGSTRDELECGSDDCSVLYGDSCS